MGTGPKFELNLSNSLQSFADSLTIEMGSNSYEKTKFDEMDKNGGYYRQVIGGLLQIRITQIVT